jgi:hypothetical protein
VNVDTGVQRQFCEEAFRLPGCVGQESVVLRVPPQIGRDLFEAFALGHARRIHRSWSEMEGQPGQGSAAGLVRASGATFVSLNAMSA